MPSTDSSPGTAALVDAVRERVAANTSHVKRRLSNFPASVEQAGHGVMDILNRITELMIRDWLRSGTEDESQLLNQVAKILKPFDSLRDRLQSDLDFVRGIDGAAMLAVDLLVELGYKHPDEDEYRLLLATIDQQRLHLAAYETLALRDQVATAAESVETSAEVAEQASSAAQESAGITGTSSLADYFTSHAADLKSTGNRWTAALVGTLVMIVIIGAINVYVVHLDEISLADVISRLALSLPFVAFALFATSRANKSLAASQRASELAVRMKSVRAYTSDLGEEQRSHIMALLGREVFTLGFDVAPNRDGPPTDPNHLMALVESARNVVQR